MVTDTVLGFKMESTSVLMLSTGYEPLFKTSWKRAISAIVSGRAEVIEVHDNLTIGTVSGKIPLPIKARFTGGILIGKIKNLSRSAKLSRKALFLRDNGKCQYCNTGLTLKTSTIDHIIPKSRGGRHEWKNVALSCARCNQKKGAKLLREAGLILKRHPYEPHMWEVLSG